MSACKGSFGNCGEKVFWLVVLNVCVRTCSLRYQVIYAFSVIVSASETLALFFGYYRCGKR